MTTEQQIEKISRLEADNKDLLHSMRLIAEMFDLTLLRATNKMENTPASQTYLRSVQIQTSLRQLGDSSGVVEPAPAAPLPSFVQVAT